MPGPDSVKVSVYSNGAGSATPSNLFEIDEVPMDSYLASISNDFTKDGIHFLRLPYSRAPVYDSSDNLDKAASIYGVYVSSVKERPIIGMDLQIRTTFGFGWVGDFGKPGVRISSEEKIHTPRNTDFTQDFFKAVFYFFFNKLFSHALQ